MTCQLPTKSVSVMLDCDAQDPERVHADGGRLDAGLVLHQEIDRAREEGDERVSLRRGDKDLCQLQLHDLGHGVEGGQELRRGVPGGVFGRVSSFGLGCLALGSCGGGCGGRLLCGSPGLGAAQRPLQEEGEHFQQLLMVLDRRRLLVGRLEVVVYYVGLGGQSRDDEVEHLAEGGGRDDGRQLEQKLQRVPVGGARNRLGVLGDRVDNGIEDGIDEGAAHRLGIVLAVEEVGVRLGRVDGQRVILVVFQRLVDVKVDEA